MTVLPWWVKLGAKLVLARMPIPYSWWRTLRLFRHGDMHRPEHAWQVFLTHQNRVLKQRALPEGFTCLELGPGDSLLSALVARAFGAGSIYMVDSGDYIVRDIGPYREMLSLLRQQGRPLPEAEKARSLDALLGCCGVSYLTDGLRSLEQIPNGSIDFVWSQVVLEHVPKSEFVPVLKELRRVMRCDAVGSHSIDLRDHLGGGLNNLRFSERVWESQLFRSSGFYTNRLRYSEMLQLFSETGFQPTVIRVLHWNQVPLRAWSMASPFAKFSRDDLQVQEFEVLLRPS